MGNDENLTTFEEQLRCALSDEEVASRADEVARTIGERDRLEGERKLASKAAKAEIERLDSEIKSLARDVRDRAEYRIVECQDLADAEEARIRTVRLDTGEEIRHRPMTEVERQRSLFPRAASSAE